MRLLVLLMIGFIVNHHVDFCRALGIYGKIADSFPEAFKSLRELGGLIEAGQTDWRQIRFVWRGPEPVGGKEPHIAHPRDWQHQRSTLRRTEPWWMGLMALVDSQHCGFKIRPRIQWIYWFVFIFPLFYGHQLEGPIPYFWNQLVTRLPRIRRSGLVHATLHWGEPGCEARCLGSVGIGKKMNQLDEL